MGKWLKSWWSRILAASGRRSGTVAAPPSASKRDLFGQIRKGPKTEWRRPLTPRHRRLRFRPRRRPRRHPRSLPSLWIGIQGRHPPAMSPSPLPSPTTTPDTGPILGIPIRTTHAVAAVVRGGKVEIIPNQEGENLTPSVVAFTADGGVLVGRPALRQAALNPGRTVYSIQTPASDATALGNRHSEDRGRAGRFERRHGWTGGRHAVAPPHSFSASCSTRRVPPRPTNPACRVDRAGIVLTMRSGKATLDARPARRPGCAVWVLENSATRCKVLQPMRIITEPTAAALAARPTPTGTGNLPSFTSAAAPSTFRSPRHRLVGRDRAGKQWRRARWVASDFDQVLIDHFAASLADRLGLDPRRDPVALSRLKEAAEQAKKDLSQSDEVRVRVPHLVRGATGPLHLRREGDPRAEFEEQLAAPLLEPLARCPRCGNRCEMSAIDRATLMTSCSSGA